MTSIIRSASMLLLVGWLIPCRVGAQTQRWRLAPELRIGSLDDEKTSLTSVRSVAVAANGDIFVSQPQEGTIRVFNSSGAFVRTIGRPGNGPGEFQRLGPIGFKGDTLYAIDLVLQRISFFRQNGGHIETIRVTSPVSADFRPAGPIGILKGGSIVAQPTVATRLVAGTGDQTVPVLQLDRKGSIIGQFPRLKWSDMVQPIRGANGNAYLRKPFDGRTMLAIAPDGSSLVYVSRDIPSSGERARFTVTRLRLPQDTIFAKTYYYQPRAVPSHVADSLKALQTTDLDKFVGREAVERAMRDFIPQYQPPISRVVVGGDGTTWLRREEYGPADPVWLVLDPQGTLIASLSIPHDGIIYAARDNKVWVIEKDEMDIPYLIRYRVVRP